MSSDSPKGQPQIKRKSHRSRQGTKHPPLQQTKPGESASTSTSTPGTSRAKPKTPRLVYDDCCGSDTDFDNYLLQLAEEHTPKMGKPTAPTGTDSSDQQTDNGLHEMVAGASGGDVDTLRDSESTDAFPSDPEFQEEVKDVTAFVKKVVQHYDVDALTVMQLLYFHNVDLDAVVSHLQTGQSDVVWTKKYDDMLKRGNPKDLQKLIDKYGQDGLVKRQTFLYGP